MESANKKSEKLDLIASIIYTDNIEYGLYSDGEIYFYNEFGDFTKLEDKTKAQEIEKYFQSPETDMRI